MQWKLKTLTSTIWHVWNAVKISMKEKPNTRILYSRNSIHAAILNKTMSHDLKQLSVDYVNFMSWIYVNLRNFFSVMRSQTKRASSQTRKVCCQSDDLVIFIPQIEFRDVAYVFV